jgi:hypothetical protein
MQTLELRSNLPSALDLGLGADDMMKDLGKMYVHACVCVMAGAERGGLHCVYMANARRVVRGTYILEKIIANSLI